MGGTLPNSPYETVSTLIHTPDRDSAGGESRRATPAWNTLRKTTDKIRAGRAEGAHRARPHAATQAGPPEARGWAGARKSIRAAQLSIDYRGSCVNLLRGTTEGGDAPKGTPGLALRPPEKAARPASRWSRGVSAPRSPPLFPLPQPTFRRPFLIPALSFPVSPAPTGHFPSHLPSPAAAASTRRHSRAPWLGRVPSVRRRELPALRPGDRIRGDLLLRSAERRRGPEPQGDLGGAAS